MDFSGMDDPTFLAERRAARNAMEAEPENDDACQRFRELDDEFDRRARAAWKDCA